LAPYKKRGVKGLQSLPNIGPSSAVFIAERLDKINLTGRKPISGKV